MRLRIGTKDYAHHFKVLSRIYVEADSNAKAAIQDLLRGADIQRTAPPILLSDENADAALEFLHAHQQDFLAHEAENLIEALVAMDAAETIWKLAQGKTDDPKADPEAVFENAKAVLDAFEITPPPPELEIHYNGDLIWRGPENEVPPGLQAVLDRAEGKSV